MKEFPFIPKLMLRERDRKEANWRADVSHLMDLYESDPPSPTMKNDELDI